MTAIDAPLADKMLASFQELETRRRLHVEGLDAVVEAMATLRALDRHLVDQGLHSALVLEHVHSEDPPLEELLEFQVDDGIRSTGDVRAEMGLATTPPPRSRRGPRAR